MEDRCELTELYVSQCDHCRPDSGRMDVGTLAAVATPGQAHKAAARSRNQAERYDESSNDLEIVARFLPAGLVDLYARVLEIEFQLSPGSRANSTNIPGVGRGSGPRISTTQTETRSVTRTHTARADWTVIRSERALMGRYRLDRKLKRIVNDLRYLLAEVNGADHTRPLMRQCAGRCRKIGESDWLFCARCGGPMQDITPDH
jgi:hypothetical protein